MKINEFKGFIYKTIIDKLDLLKETVIIQWTSEKKVLLLPGTKLIEKYLILIILNNYEIFLKNKNKRSVSQAKITTQQP